MRTSFDDFLKREKHTLSRNIERLQHDIEQYEDDDPMANGSRKMLGVQLNHLEMFNMLAEESHDPEFIRTTCLEALKIEENKHRRLGGENIKNKDEWWETLNIIQFLTGIIYRIEEWQQFQLEHR